jgi:hypothetical protein
MRVDFDWSGTLWPRVCMVIGGTVRRLGPAKGQCRKAGGRYGKVDASVERQLDPARRSIESRDFESGLRRKIVGQEEAVQAVVDLYQVFRAIRFMNSGANFLLAASDAVFSTFSSSPIFVSARCSCANPNPPVINSWESWTRRR